MLILNANHSLPARDLSTFFLLTHLPTYALLSWFYKIRPIAVLCSYTIVIFSSAAPFLILRKKPAQASTSPPKPPSSPILHDRPTTLYTTLAATAIFSLILYISFATWLPAHIVAHFTALPDISVTHTGPAGWPVLFLTLLPVGYIARDFLFAGWARAVAEDASEDEKGSRDGEYLVCVLYRKTWGALGAGTRVLLSRIVALTVMTLLNTVVQVAWTVDGADAEGAGIWGAVWAASFLVVGAVFGWIGAADGEI
jgi:hypothetical protein